MPDPIHPLRVRPWSWRLLVAPLWAWRCYRGALACGLREDEARRWAWEQTRRLVRRRR